MKNVIIALVMTSCSMTAQAQDLQTDNSQVSRKWKVEAETGVSFTQRNCLYQCFGGDAWETHYTNNFIGVPLTGEYYLLHIPFKENGLWLEPQVGVYYDKSTYDFNVNESHLRRNLIGGEAGIRAGYSHSGFDTFIDYRYRRGLTPVYQEKSRTGTPAHRNSRTFSAGASYRFKF